MTVISSPCFNQAYADSLWELFQGGKYVFPRGQKTLELAPYVLHLENPRDRIISVKERNINLGFNILEFLSIVAGDNTVKRLAELNPGIVQYSDDGEVFRGAYGPRLRNNAVDQFKQVIDKLKEDKDSRQAIMTIFDPKIDYVVTKDVPCTISFHFMIRNNKLNMNVYMRSNDAMLGHVIDVFVFTMIQELIANELGCELGEYYHFAGSFHLYEKDFEKAIKIANGYKSFTCNSIMPKMEGGIDQAIHAYNFNYGKLNTYWHDIAKTIEYQLLFRNKQYDEINFMDFYSFIFKDYFMGKIKNVTKNN